MRNKYPKIALIAFFLAALAFPSMFSAQGMVLLEKEWRFVDRTLANLAADGDKALNFLPYIGGHNNDDYRAPTGSVSLNSTKITENWNGVQMTIGVGIESLGFVPGDGFIHYILDNQGTDATTNRIELYIDAAGLLIFDLHDTDSTQHRVQFDITDWSLTTPHQVAARFDLNADEIELYTDGVSRDSTPDNALSSDIISAIGSITQLGADTSQANQLNGAANIIVENRSWSDAEITADYDSGAGTPRVVTQDTILMDRFKDKDTGIAYTSHGKSVSAISNGATESSLTTAAGADGVFADNDRVLVSDATGFSKPAFVDGTPTDTNVDVDDGAGAVVTDIEKAGVSIFCDETYYTQGGDILDITTEDFEIDFWMKQDGDPGAIVVVLAKAFDYFGLGYTVYLDPDGLLILRADDTVDDANFFFDVTAFLDNRWHHYYLFADRSNIATSAIYVDGVSKTIGVSGTFPVQSLTNGDAFTISATSGRARIFIGQIRDARIHIGGTMSSSAQILKRATNPLLYDNTTWTLDGTREYWELTEGSGTINTAGVTSPGNNLTLSNAAAWIQSARISRNLLVDPGMEDGGIAPVGVHANSTVTKDTSVVKYDGQSRKHVFASADDNDEDTIATLTLANAVDIYQSIYIKTAAIHDDSTLFLDIDGSATPILSREIGKSLGDNGVFARSFGFAGMYEAFAANNTINDIAEEDIGLAFWAKFTDSGATLQWLIGKGTWSGTSDWVVIYDASQTRVFLVISDGAGDHFSLLTFQVPSDLKWHHYAFIIDKDNENNCTISIDGLAVALSNNGTVTDVGSIANAYTFRLGNRGSGAFYFQGQSRDVVLAYPADIMAANEMGAAGEIANLFNNPGDPSQWPNSEDYWLCNDNAANAVVTGAVNNLTASANTDTFATYNWKMYEMTWQADQEAITAKLRITGAGGGANDATVYIDQGHVKENLIVNGGMEGVYAGGFAPSWSQTGNGTPAEEGTIVHSGSKSQKFSLSAEGGGFFQAVTLISGSYYTVSAWVLSDNAAVGLGIGDSALLGNADGSMQHTGGGDWEKLATTIKATDTGKLVFVRTDTSITATFYVDDVVLTRLDTADASVADKGDGLVPINQPFFPADWQ